MNKRHQPKRERPSRHRKRLLFMQVILLGSLGVIGLRMAYVINAFGPRLQGSAKNVQDVSVTQVAPRGTLLDSTGHPLAYDVPAFMFDIKLNAFSDSAKLASLLSQPLGMTVDQLMQKFDSDASDSWIQFSSPIFQTTRDAVIAALKNVKDDKGLPATSDITFTPTSERAYPYGTFAANTLGYVSAQDHTGEGGLELEYNKVLSGKNGEYTYVKDGDGFPIQSTMKTVKKAVPGENIQLTLDQTIQGFVENEMNTLVAKYKPVHAAIIVMNPKNGAILAISSRPNYNPNQYWLGSPVALNNNWAVNSSFEPGSTFKVMVLAGGLASNVISLNETFMSGHITVAGTTIHDWNYTGWGQIDFRNALYKSSNVGFATVAEKLGWPKLLQWMKSFGYLNKTGVDLPGEYNSVVFPPDARGPVQLATSGFGQGISVTPMQQMAAVAAIANGGALVRPHLAQEFIDQSTGKVVKQVTDTIVNPHVISSDVASQVRNVMIGDVQSPAGIDGLGYIKGYEVGGKTGTAQIAKPNGGYYTDRFITSFIGFAPGWDPQIEVYVTLYWPHVPADQQWGSSIATPPARNILQECLQYYHIQPQSGQSTTRVVAPTVKTSYVETPNLIGESVTQAASKLHQLGLTGFNIGQTSGVVTRQWPEPGIAVATGSSMYFYAPTKSGTITLPDLRGMSMREAANMLSTLGLTFVPKGSGFVTSQSIAPGQSVSPGAQVVVSLSPTPLDNKSDSQANTTIATNSQGNGVG